MMAIKALLWAIERGADNSKYAQSRYEFRAGLKFREPATRTTLRSNSTAHYCGQPLSSTMRLRRWHPSGSDPPIQLDSTSIRPSSSLSQTSKWRSGSRTDVQQMGWRDHRQCITLNHRMTWASASEVRMRPIGLDAHSPPQSTAHPRKELGKALGWALVSERES